MNFYDRLIAHTEAEREGFQRIPLIREVMGGGATRAMYLIFSRKPIIT